jgi:5-hydroxyisourate hydrolase-like protein (transthyretin family)
MVMNFLPAHPVRRFPRQTSSARLIARSSRRTSFAQVIVGSPGRTSSAGAVRTVLAAVSLVAALGATTPATANEYTINACQADRANYSTHAFEDFATRGMMWKRACDPEGPGLRGLVTANVVRSGRVARGARSYFVMRAPVGTRFARFSWSGQARRRDCRYALQLWASRPDGPPVPIKNVRANRRCPRRNFAQAAGWPRARTYGIDGATKIVQRVVCVGAKRTPYCSSRGLNYIRTFKAQATVVDVSAPVIGIAQDNPFTRGEWVSGIHSVTYGTWDNAGVRLVRPLLAGVPYGGATRDCDFSQRIPCTNGQGRVSIDTRSLIEGSQPLTLQAEDAAGNPGDSNAVTVRVDNTAPGAVQVALEGGERWWNQNNFDPAWVNQAEADRAPIMMAHYRLCRTGTAQCVEGAQSAVGIGRLTDLAVPDPGEWQLRVWREDAAGNKEPANASVPIALRYDPDPPQLGFEPSPASDPTAVSVQVTDAISGLAGGQIELSQAGSGTWHSLATQAGNGRLVSRIDDASFAPGDYLLRASARDQAGNQNSTDRRLDGTPMAITLPLRVPTTLRAGVVKSRTVRRTTGRGQRRRRVRRRVEVLRPRARIGFGDRTRIRAVLENTAGQPIAGAEIQVFSRSSTVPEQLVDVIRTDGHGRYSYVARASYSRTLRFIYNGTALTLPAEREVTLLVRAASTIRAKPRRLVNGETVRFTGKLRSLPTPPAGKLVELQVVLSGRWQTFRTALTEADGSWRVRYRFRRSCGLLRYRFRARLPAEAGYTFETGRTRVVAVRVRGRPCR